jgi:hypothetical protein
MARALAKRPFSPLLALGLLGLAFCQAFLFAHILKLLPPGDLEFTGRVVRANMTPFAWCCYLVILFGLLTYFDRRSWLKRFRNRLVICWLWSIPAWCYFDWMNFYFMTDPATGLRAWEYIKLPLRFEDRLVGYLFAFGAIAPGMFLTADILQRAGFHRLNTTRASDATRHAIENPKPKIENRIALAVFLLGLALTPIPILVGTPASNLAIWVGTWALLDPINRHFRRPSILTDWFHGRWGRTLALGLGGLICGFLWEFWNYWAVTKWIYHLPFLGHLEPYKYFEMPALGLIGFIAFALETWAMWQTSLLILSPLVEAESNTTPDQFHHDYACL